MKRRVGSYEETPPLARGRHVDAFGGLDALGNTPACAGKTELLAKPCESLRNTPACAGKTWPQRCLRVNVGKHPRLRGEDLGQGHGHHGVGETPPLARGRQNITDNAIGGQRNTPACAGKTPSAGRNFRTREKHPRLRGEDLAMQEKQQLIEETPPLARGRHASLTMKNDLLRNTPACAGKTRRTRSSPSVGQKHPRLRGEDFTPTRRDLMREETPPLARGRQG